ncbi:DEAD/DEAH box helicase [Corynebacterium vitaeruminis]|uniref:Helicase/UvrB N-terminal domain-containing protein n=1 Tax=Corynebacterium vitaeruminis DSM 20294 TaxID=1224164 RepID=W5YBL6_9CORY|nr:DEAD/DEAH box helicase family protein [Corynebacterium vitaeruminis]AHI23918.1 hypothetical protein B843_12710 [Corynebacterium vitaeruminis DSM 20294]
MSFAVSYDENLVAELATRFDLRTPNVEALSALVKRIESGEFDPREPLVMNLATGAGKTYVMASFIEYLRRQSVRNVMVVTPGTVVQDKTVRDLREGSNRYVGGFEVPPRVVTPDSMRELTVVGTQENLFGDGGASTVFVFNVQQLFPPKEGGKSVATGMEAARRKVYLFQEDTGVLAQRLIDMDDLVVIADESHLFGSSAKVFRSSLTNLKPAVTVGLTASPDSNDDIVFKYPLWRAIVDGYVKQPVLVYRKSGYDSSERQLQDAVSLLRFKEEQYADYRARHPEGKQTKPLLFVVCSDVNHATETTEYLKNTHFPDSPTLGRSVLQVDNQHDDAATQALLANLDADHSPIRAIVSVNKLREGWDTKRIAVMCTLRAMGSEVLTQQVMGRGLRLPFEKKTNEPAIDQLDIISHKSFVSLLESENVLREFGIEEDMPKQPTLVDPDAVPGGNSVSPFGGGLETSTGGGLPTETGIETDGGATSPYPASVPNPLVVAPLGDDKPIVPPVVVKPVTVRVNEQFADTSFLFPTSAMVETKRAFALVDIELQAVEDAAKKVHDAKEQLERTAIVATEEGSLAGDQLDRQAVPSFRQSTEAVKRELIRRVVHSRGIEPTKDNDTQLRLSIVPRFMEATGITQWTEKAKQSAVEVLCRLVAEESKKAATKNTLTEVEVRPQRVPVTRSYELPLGEKVFEQLAVGHNATKQSTGFMPGRHYGTWNKGLFEAAKFDSYSAEYALAYMLNYDSDVKWWTRIYPESGAHIAYTTRDNYIPDFVVCDKVGTFWIIEGKREDMRDDAVVLAKRSATEKVLRMLVAHPEFIGQAWGYVLAFEGDIKRAESLADLVSMDGVVRPLV